MKLNADILADELSVQYRITMKGTPEKSLSLSRPEFYMDGEESFLAGHLYLATVEHLPRRPKIQKNAVLVCIGESVVLKYYEERLCLITIHNKADFFKVYQYIQGIFDSYDEWERTLYRDLLSEDALSLAVNDSVKIFRAPVFVLDSSFHFIARSREAEKQAGWSLTDSGNLDPSALSAFLRASDLMTDRHGPLDIDLNGIRTLCVNLFNEEGEYRGCLCIPADEGLRSGCEELAEFLAGIAETALQRDTNLMGEETSSLKSVMRNLIDEQPLSQSQRLVLNAANHKTPYICAVFRYANQKNRIPAGYICDSFEERYAGSYAIAEEDTVICFIQQDKNTGQALNAEEFLASMKLKAGLSDAFTDLFDIRIHYHQALCAIENGSLIDPDKTVYTFEDYALSELILNALGEMPSTSYFPHGLNEIVSHDESSGVSYLETLKVFLEENLSYTAAARRLYIHRSTLIDRIARIEKELGFSLKDPDQRLRIQIVLKAMEIEKQLRSR